MDSALHKWIKIAVFSILGLVPRASEAQSFCEAVQRYTQETTPQNFEVSDIAGECRTFREHTGAKGVMCNQPFPYRSEKAVNAFAALNDSIQTCLGSSAGPTQDQAVNHPDSYVLYQYVVENMKVSASLKDKAALQQTIVFLRITKDLHQ
ncbi:hypothetical protein ROA7450_04030 [Roseovarius albus]|uniref:Uncharacterized protein n=1 Tax=Roseovarius albus TaxID=1247867 RepID=A0A1X7A7F3_9RHOB|nr:hypothetical protein [Roseovarius albus]SLN72334.1 hypothetical protein ROA7450_04030 [Roseovarius albus]